jgi:hypothetical protein
MKYKEWLTPSGAAVMGVCFFLPWANFSCTGLHARVSGADLGGVLWVIPLLAATIFAVFFVLRKRGFDHIIRWMVLGTAAIILLVLVGKIIAILTAPKPAFGLIKPEHVGFRLGLGAFGTLAGLAGMAGGILLKSSRLLNNDS